MNTDTEKTRDHIIVRTSLLGVGANLMLAAFKAVIGVFSHSVAIVLDAVNNLSDALSSVITIIGTKLAGKAPDKEHPYGHGRSEYISSTVISMIVLYAGITSLAESVKKIIDPLTPDYSAASLIIVITAIFVKIFLGRYVKATGIKVNSDSLKNSGKDALMDALISFTTLVAAVIYLTKGISLEAWLAAGISLYIIQTGVQMIRETFSRILGERINPELAKSIKQTICGIDHVLGAYDLTLNSYGPEYYMGSVDVEVTNTMTADDIDELSREIQSTVYLKHRVVLSAVGIYSVNTANPEITEIHTAVGSIIARHKNAIQFHGFRCDLEKKSITFDVVLSFDAEDRAAECEEIRRDVQEAYPAYRVSVTLDTYYSD